MLEGAASLQGQLIGAESQLEGLRQIYSDNNIRVRTTQARIAELRSQLQKMGGTSVDNRSRERSKRHGQRVSDPASIANFGSAVRG